MFATEGIDIRVGVRVDRVEPDPNGLRIDLAGGPALVAQQLLVAVGRAAATTGLNAARAGVQLDDRRFVVTDEHLRTSATGVYPAGDVTGRMPFTHAAFEMGRIAVGNALSRGRRRRYSTAATPWVTFTDPEVARVGITADAAGAAARVAYLPMTGWTGRSSRAAPTGTSG